MTQQDFDILWMSRPRLIKTGKFIRRRDRDSSRLRDFLDVETETHRDWKISWMSRLRLIETEKFLGCRDRYSSRLGKSMDVETKTSRDWAKDVDTETPSRLSLISEAEGVTCNTLDNYCVEVLLPGVIKREGRLLSAI